MKRIAVLGPAGAGKTTLAGQIATCLNLSHIELDILYHDAKGIILPSEKFRQEVALALAENCWVLDSDHKRVFDIIWKQSDTVIWLDYSLGVVLYRLTRRTVQRAITREKLHNGKPQSLYKEMFTRKSLFWSAINSYQSRKHRLIDIMQQPEYQHVVVSRFVAPKQTARWLASLQSNQFL